MYFPRNWEFGSALSKLLNNLGEGGLNPPGVHQYDVLCQSDFRFCVCLLSQINLHYRQRILQFTEVSPLKKGNQIQTIYTHYKTDKLGIHRNVKKMKQNNTPEIPLTEEKFCTETFNNWSYYHTDIHTNWHSQNTCTVRTWHKYTSLWQH
jgi:hypothetical protein